MKNCHQPEHQARLHIQTARDIQRQLDEAVRIDMAERYGRVLGDRSEGVGGTSVVLNRKEEHYNPKVVHYNFYT